MKSGQKVKYLEPTLHLLLKLLEIIRDSVVDGVELVDVHLLRGELRAGLADLFYDGRAHEELVVVLTVPKGCLGL